MNRACHHCTGICREGRLCPYSADTAIGTLRVFVRVFGPYVAAVLLAVAVAAAPTLLDGEGPQPADIAGSQP